MKKTVVLTLALFVLVTISTSCAGIVTKEIVKQAIKRTIIYTTVSEVVTSPAVAESISHIVEGAVNENPPSVTWEKIRCAAKGNQAIQLEGEEIFCAPSPLKPDLSD